MKKIIWLQFLLLFAVMSFTLTGLAANFIVCKSKFALCTTAKCTPTEKKGFVSCSCKVLKGYSVGMKPCQKMKNTSEGQLIKSRYFPIKGYVRCTNNRPWAWCLDSPCFIDKKHPKTAACICSVVKNQGTYIIVTDKYRKSICKSGLYSSATVVQSNQITKFLKQQNKLQPFPIKVYKSN
jgi:hypothetical protein